MKIEVDFVIRNVYTSRFFLKVEKEKIVNKNWAMNLRISAKLSWKFSIIQ